MNSASQKVLGLVEMMSRLVNASFSLPKWQAVKMIFFAPCTGQITIQWIEIYLVDSTVHLLNKWDLILSDCHKNAGIHHT